MTEECGPVIMYMSDLSASWNAETIALLINKALVVDQGTDLAPGQIRLERMGDAAAVRLEFFSPSECQQVAESYQGLAIPHTHGYHHYQFHETWPPETLLREETTTPQIKTVPSPPLHLQLLAVPHKELRRRLSKLQPNDKSMDQFLKENHQKSKVWIHCFLVHTFMTSVLKGAPRAVHYQSGIPVAEEWTNKLWQALRQIPSSNNASDQLSWPPVPKQRKGVQSSHYLTVRQNHPPHQESLWNLCRDLLQSTCTTLPAYNALAITKNFVGSPHRDAHDQTFQHVIAVGNFTGGRLCCEGDDEGRQELQMDIHNRIGRMDGRKVHWVSAWEGEERYSVVYYSTRKEDWTEPVPQSRHVEWMQQGNECLE